MSLSDLHTFVEKSLQDIQDQFKVQYEKQLELHHKSITTDLNIDEFTPFYGKIESQYIALGTSYPTQSMRYYKVTFDKILCENLQQNECIVMGFCFLKNTTTQQHDTYRNLFITNFGNLYSYCNYTDSSGKYITEIRINNNTNPVKLLFTNQLTNKCIDLIKNLHKNICKCECNPSTINKCDNTNINYHFTNVIEMEIFTKILEIIIEHLHTYYNKFVQLKPHFDLKRENDLLIQQIKDIEKKNIDELLKQKKIQDDIDIRNKILLGENDQLTKKIKDMEKIREDTIIVNKQILDELVEKHKLEIEELKLVQKSLIEESENLAEQVLFLKDKNSKVRNLVAENDRLERELSTLQIKLEQTITTSADHIISQHDETPPPYQ